MVAVNRSQYTVANATQGIEKPSIKKTEAPTFSSGGEPNASEESPLVQTKSKGPGEFVFPKDLSSIDHFMSFDVFEHTFRRKTEPTKDEREENFEIIKVIIQTKPKIKPR